MACTHTPHASSALLPAAPALQMPIGLADLFEAIDEATFRVDLSSTQLRKMMQERAG